jgi:hypothetical protein
MVPLQMELEFPGVEVSITLKPGGFHEPRTQVACRTREVGHFAAVPGRVGDDLVEIYPVRTTMSRFENLNADYAVRIVPSAHEFEPTAATKIPKAIEAHLSKLDPDRSGKVACLVTATEPGRETDEGFGLLLDNRFWCKQLGFEIAGWRQI